MLLKNFKIECSARHVHLSQKDFIALFGPDAELNVEQNLAVAGEFKSDKRVTIVGAKRNLERVAVLGPWRAQTQVEISYTDAFTLGLKIGNVPVRMSGDLAGSAPVTLLGPNGKLDLSEGMIIAQPHLHINDADMDKFALVDNQKIDIDVGERRPVTFHDVVVRKSAIAEPTVHLDTDEWNATL